MSTGETRARRRCCRSRSRIVRGKSSAGRRLTPSRSRTVLLYSVRFRRRKVTRPGSGGRAASALAISRSTKPVSSAICFARRPRLLLFGRHVAVAELADDELPAVGVVGQGLERVVGLQVQLALLPPRAVTGGAVLHHERLHQALEGVGRASPRRAPAAGFAGVAVRAGVAPGPSRAVPSWPGPGWPAPGPGLPPRRDAAGERQADGESEKPQHDARHAYAADPRGAYPGDERRPARPREKSCIAVCSIVCGGLSSDCAGARGPRQVQIASEAGRVAPEAVMRRYV